MKRIALFLLFARLVAAGADLAWQAERPFPPSQAAETMRLPEGFRVTVFAAEPDVQQPIGMCVDDRGRVWIAEAFSYPNFAKQGQADRILILEDTDGDGRADKRTVFFDKLNYVTGLEVGFGGVWVMSPPYLLFIADRNGDDRPDAAPEVLLDGFGTQGNAHNIANGFAWGPDGWLYGTHGRTSWSLVGKPGTPERDRERFDGGVYRYHPVRREWEPFADGCTNPWGIDWDDFGQAFIPNTVDPHLFHASPGAHYEPWRNRESSRFAYQRIATIADHLHFLGRKDVRAGLGSEAETNLGGGHSHCGILVYLGDNWPERYRNTVLLHNTHGRRINHDLPARKGSGYSASHARDFAVIADPWFMGVSFAPAPDGTVYITDWSDTGECHSLRNTRRETGRIYKISYGRPAWKRENLAALNDAELVARQLHRNDWQVRHARRLLQERAVGGADLTAARRALGTMLEENPDVTRKLRALWALHSIGGLGDAERMGLLSHTNEHLRAWAVRLLCENRNPPKVARERFVDLAKNDPSPLVRLHLSSTLQRLAPAQRWEIAAALLAHAEDASDQNLPLMNWYAIEPLVHEDVRQFVALAEKSAIPLVQRHVARRVASLEKPERGLNEVTALLTRVDDRARAELLDGLLQGVNGRAGLRPPEGWSAAAAILRDRPAVAFQALELGCAFGDPDSIAALQRLAGNRSLPEARRVEAAERAMSSGGDGIAAWLLSGLDDPVLQRSALRGLAKFDHPDTVKEVLRVYPALADVAARRDAIQTLASRPAWAAALLGELEAGRIPRGDMTGYMVRQVTSLGDKRLAARMNRFWGEIRQTPNERQRRIDALVLDLSDKLDRADLGNGRALFQTACAACHKLFGEGGRFGPDLTGSQRSSLEYLILHIMDPNASVARDYQMQVVELADGRVLTGMVTAETETTLTLRTLTEDVPAMKGQIRKQSTASVSIMPEGLLDALTKPQIRDLMGYLQSPAQVPLPAASPPAQ